MPLTNDEQIELAALKPKLAARRGLPGYAQNAADIERRIAELEQKRDA